MTMRQFPTQRAEETPIAPRQRRSAEREHCTLIQPMRAHIAGRILRALINHEPPAEPVRDAAPDIPDNVAISIDAPQLMLKTRTAVALAAGGFSAADAEIEREGSAYMLYTPVDPAPIVQALFSQDAQGIPASIRLLGADYSGTLQPTKRGLAMANGIKIVRRKDGWALACPLPADRLLDLLIGD